MTCFIATGFNLKNHVLLPLKSLVDASDLRCKYSKVICSIFGLLGTKIVLNEFVAYLDLGSMIQTKAMMNSKTILMATYALCGFANFSSIAIQIGGTGSLAPSRKSDIAKLGIKAVIGGSLATLMTATLAGLLFS